ncbi:MAG: hypothetical protein C0467_29835, partial [Planctomycetaceae bacterium]|nr:hypothetical protein [Planctomycetaceae bacterium]
MFRSNPLLAWCRSHRNSRVVSTIRRPAALLVEPLEVRCVPATFNITNQNDGALGSGSLRSAIISSNTSFQNQTNTINLSNGTYSLSLGGQFEDAAATGDLDITGNQTMIIQGAGAGVTFIDAKQIDRVFQVVGSGVTVTFKNLTITGGYIEATPDHLTLHGGGILNEGGNVTLTGVTVTGNELTGYTDTAGGGIYSDGGRLTITGSMISANKLGYIEQYSGNLNGATGARGNDGHPVGYNGTSGQNAPAGGNVSGGGVYVRNTITVVTSSTITANTIRAGDGVSGGSGGAGGHGNKNAVSNGYPNVIPGDMGGNAGNGGAGGAGGAASGAGIAADGGTLTITDVQITSNAATGGAGGAGGTGGEGGAYVGYQGRGGAAGSGGEARGAVYVTGSSSLTINGATRIESNTATGGTGGTGGRAGAPGLGYVVNAGLPGPTTSETGGTGGLASGAGLTILGGTATITGLQVRSNIAVGGAGGTGGQGSVGHDEINLSDTDNSIPGGKAGNGGTGGSVQGGGVFVGAVTLSMTDTTISSNAATGGNGGAGGRGGEGGDGAGRNFYFSGGGAGSVGGNGGNGGGGGAADGGGMYVSGSETITIRSTTIASNSVTAGSGGTGGAGGGGGTGGYGLFDDGSDARGGDGGNGGGGGATGAGGLYIFATSSSKRATVANVTVAYNTMTGGTGAAGGGGGLGGDGGDGGNGSTGTVGGVTASTSMVGGGIIARSYVTIANATVAYNVSGIFTTTAGTPFSVQIGNTISAKNTSRDIVGQFTSTGNNLIGAYDSALASALAASDLRGSVASPLDPKLSTILQSKGGSTQVLYPTSDSPVINAGGTPLAGVTTDQRGVARQVGSAVDIGAVEVANGFFSTSYNIPTSAASGADVQATVTVVIGDNVTGFVSQATVPSTQATLLFSSVPSGWTVATYGTGYEIRATFPGPGVYTIPVTVRVSSATPYGTPVQLRFVDSIDTGLSYLATPTVTVQYPVPTVTSINPSSLNEGSPATLTVVGTGFGIGSVVKWNGTNLVTTYVNRNTLTAALPVSLAESGTASVTVFSPTPGGGTSNATNFTVNTVSPTGVIPDRYVVYPGTGSVPVSVGFVAAFDPSLADTAAGLRYSYANSIATLAADYATARTSAIVNLNITAVGTRTFYARVYDKDGGISTYTVNVYSVAANAAPTLTGANNLPTINEDAVANTGSLVSDLIAGKFGDTDAVSGRGIAVTGLTGTHGKWQFSTNGGLTWTDFGPVSDASATLLGAAATDRVRFLPDTQDGTTATITFRAWDQTDGRTTGTTGISVSTNGGSTAYSSDPATASLTVTEVNDFPVFTTLDYSIGLDGVLRIPVADVLAATPRGPAAESGQTLTLVGVRVDTFGQVTGSAGVSNGNIVFRPTAGRSGYALVYYTVRDNGTTNGVIDPKLGQGLIRVLVDSSPAVGAVDDVLPTITQGAAAFEINTDTLTANDVSSQGRAGTVTLTAVSNAVGGTVQFLDTPGHGARLEFTPDAGFVGVAGFTYTITDDQNGAQSQGIVQFIVQPPDPVIELSEPLNYGTATWVDVNRDGHLDVVISSVIFLGDGAGGFTGEAFGLGFPLFRNFTFGDLNRDGYLDVIGVTNDYKLGVYTFDPGANSFTEVSTYSTSIRDVYFASWADFDNDGDLDIVVSGFATSPSGGFNTTHLVRNDAGNFTTYAAGNSIITSASFADADGDGDLDMLANTPSNGPLYFRNNGGLFGAGVGNPSNNTGGTVSTWGDYDGDGFPDFVAAGLNPAEGYELAIYHNNGNGTFSYLSQLGTSDSNATDLNWADVDSDGDLDLIQSRLGENKVWLNDAGTFFPATETEVPILPLLSGGGTPAWGDYDNNGTLDAALPPGGQYGAVVTNYGALPTNPPTAPTDLAVVLPTTGNTVRLSWDGASDDNTPTSALTYTIRIGTTPGGNDIMSAPALADGTRLVAAPGAYSKPFADVTLAGGQMCYWEVQAVDATLQGSVFSSGSFYFNHAPQMGGGFAFATEDTPLALTPANFLSSVSDADGDTIQSIRIDALPSNGTLLYQGSAVAVGQIIPVTGPDYNAANWLVFDPAPNYSTQGVGGPETIRYAVSDGHDFSGTGDLNIMIQPVTDAPYLTVADVTVPAGAPGAFPITAGSADDDGSEDVRIDILGLPPGVTFSAGALDVNVWRLTPADLPGLMILVASPVPTSFDLTIFVTNFEPGASPTAPITEVITVTTVAPTIDSVTVPATGVEGTAARLSATASDPSTTGLTYTWQVLTPYGVVELAGPSVEFTPLDNGPYLVFLTVTDGQGAVARSTPQFIRIDNADPVIASVANNGPMGEGQPVTITVDASDAAGDYDPLTYLFDYDNDGSYESLDATHTFTAAGEYTVGVRVIDGDTGSADGTTTVTVTHANPTAPSDADSADNTVVEGAVAGTQVGVTAAATQPNGLTVTYSLTDNAGGRFAIDAASGVVKVAEASLLNFETVTSYTITVQADDGYGGTSTADFAIAVTNADPSLPADSDTAANAVVEGAANGTAVGITAAASDANGPTVTFRLTDDAGGRFAIDTTAGIITVADGSLLNFETATSHTVTVEASDGAGGTSTQTFTIDVTNADPGAVTDADVTTNTVVEGAAVGTVVGVTATAADVNGPTVTYSLTNNAGGRFAIDATTGVITVADASLLNFETATSHTITVQTSDGQGGTSTADFIIAVANANPGPVTDADAATNTVVEGAAVGTVVGITAAATDVNGPAVAYSLTDDAGGRFAIDAASGVVTVADASLLDYETATSHTITVQADDGAGGTSTADFTIAVTNADPSLPADSDTAANAVVEGAANGTAVGITAAATDVNSLVTYSLTDDAGGRFTI